MAFQDSCGDIILDAILTDLGRKKMAQGDFRVTKFSLGDDEVDYSLRSTQNQLYKNPRITDLPVFEAFNAQNAVINYGLVVYTRLDVFYTPTLKSLESHVDEALRPYNNYYYFSVNSETSAKLRTKFGSNQFHIENNEPVKTKLIISSGIIDSAAPADLLGKERFLMSTGLYDSYYAVYCDSRFIQNTMAPPIGSYIKNDTAGNVYANFAPLQPNVKISLAQVLDHYDCYRFSGFDNMILKNENGSGVLPHSGSRGTVTAMNFVAYDRLSGVSQAGPADEYYIFGTTGHTLFGGSDKYDYIDTTIYVEGLSSNASIRVPLRIIRYAGT